MASKGITLRRFAGVAGDDPREWLDEVEDYVQASYQKLRVGSPEYDSQAVLVAKTHLTSPARDWFTAIEVEWRDDKTKVAYLNSKGRIEFRAQPYGRSVSATNSRVSPLTARIDELQGNLEKTVDLIEKQRRLHDLSTSRMMREKMEEEAEQQEGESSNRPSEVPPETPVVPRKKLSAEGELMDLTTDDFLEGYGSAVKSAPKVSFGIPSLIAPLSASSVSMSSSQTICRTQALDWTLFRDALIAQYRQADTNASLERQLHALTATEDKGGIRGAVNQIRTIARRLKTKGVLKSDADLSNVLDALLPRDCARWLRNVNADSNDFEDFAAAAIKWEDDEFIINSRSKPASRVRFDADATKTTADLKPEVKAVEAPDLKSLADEISALKKQLLAATSGKNNSGGSRPGRTGNLFPLTPEEEQRRIERKCIRCGFFPYSPTHLETCPEKHSWFEKKKAEQKSSASVSEISAESAPEQPQNFWKGT